MCGRVSSMTVLERVWSVHDWLTGCVTLQDVSGVSVRVSVWTLPVCDAQVTLAAVGFQGRYHCAPVTAQA